MAALLAGGTPARADDAATARLWAVTRAGDGRLHVVRGMRAAIARMDVQLGRTDTQVLSTEDDRPVSELGDPLRPQQWALDQTSFELAWPTVSGSGVTVAVVDTGVLAAHEDLAGAVVAGTDLASDAHSVDPFGTGMVDPAGHGTHVAGIIGARVNNGRGIAGAAPNVKILPVRVLDAHGTGVASNVAEGIIWAADHGARVINLSLGGGPSPGMETAMQYANGKGAVVLAAAGNSYQSGNAPTYPAAYPEAIAVASVNQSLSHSSFSNTGSYVDIAAPGEMILSTYSGSTHDYEWMSGTSMATPYASAAAALIVGTNPSLSAADIERALESTARDLGAPGRDDTFGYGLIDPRAAVATLQPRSNNGTQGNGYWIVTADGSVRTFGSATFYGDLTHVAHSQPIVAGARTPTGRGYWLVGADGAIYTFGDAQFHGSMYGRHLDGHIVGMAATPSGRGYVLLGQDGGIFTFGDAEFHGSTGGWKLVAPVLDMTMTQDGHGYWFVAADGGVFSFGDAHFHGSTGGMHLWAPVRSMTAAANGAGYWMVAADGGIFAFNVPFLGSFPGQRSVPTVRMRALKTSGGYYMLGANGAVYAFGAAKYFGSATGTWAVDLMLTP
ncbi:MAG TPA: S8 family serine peptidase [Acidimicrobiia bacterium]|nr:S8 family serine peptidase [Acidimicrobiia bacterium]